MARITWDDLPAAVRHRVEELLGAPVVAHASHTRGFFLKHLEVAHHPEPPWTKDPLAPVLAACLDLSDRLTPSPLAILDYLTEACRQPAPPGLPTIRESQHGLADGMTDWAKHSTLIAGACRP